MSYAILSAAYANPEHTAAIVQTPDRGAVALSVVDTPEHWAALMASGVVVSSFTPPPAPVPATITRQQCAKAAYLTGQFVMTDQEVIDWAGKGIPPAAIKALIDNPANGMTAQQRVLAYVDIAKDDYERANPLLNQLMVGVTGKTSADIDAFFIFADTV